MKFITYYRVSTIKQGQSGLGLEAQERAIQDYLSFNNGEVIGSFTEIESGKKNDREELMKALKMCRQYNATLLISKLDRLSRDVSFISSLMKSEVKFIATDNPNVNELTIHILSALAQHEREMTSKRTKEALARAKERGVKLGSPQNLRNRDKGTRVSSEVRSAKADVFAKDTYEIIKPLLDSGYSLNNIAKEFNKRGLLTARGKTGSWTARSIKNIIERVSQ